MIQEERGGVSDLHLFAKTMQNGSAPVPEQAHTLAPMIPVSVYLWKSHKFKLLSLLLLLLLILQYFFGARVYNVHWFDYDINLMAGITRQLRPSTERPPPVQKTVRFTSSPEIVERSGGSNATGNVTSSGASTLRQNLTSDTESTSLPLCPLVPPVLVGPIRVWFDYPSMKELEKLYPYLEPGGRGRPRDCRARHRVAVIIPYRDRDKHLRGFLHNMHSLLTKQQLDYSIVVVEQVAKQTFNRAKLMNVGFVEALKLHDWDCFVFHDVDLLPEDDRNLYSCPEQPRHMSVAVDKFSYKLPYGDIFGGISALSKEQMFKINGMSNDYWGWGGEDDDLATRVKVNGYRITRYPANIARYKMIKHVHDQANPVNTCRFKLLYKTKTRWKKDGLSNLDYTLLHTELGKLYTRFLVDLNETESQKKIKTTGIC